tara:strand:- start:619 stop:2031 length:1413 start_codon:yes stop_codon:yes gene_type:complete
MSKNIVEELPARKHTPVAAAPAAAKKEGGDSSDPKGGNTQEASAKRISQAVYDIRYRAKTDKITLEAAYNSYMGNSNLTKEEKDIVKERLFGKKGGGVKEQFSVGVDDLAGDGVASALYKVFVENEEKELELSYVKQLDESEEKKYKVRVTDNTGKAYVRFATRSKITQLRGNSNIKSVEMTEHGDVLAGQKKTKDYDGDGKVESPSKEHAGAVHNAIQKKKGLKPDGKDTRKEALNDAWGKTFISDGTITTEPKGNKKISGEAVDNYKSGAVKVAPTDTQDDPSVKAARGGIYASFAHQKMLDTLAEKAACKSEKDKKKTEAYSESTVNTPDCEKKEEEEKDMRGYYAKINMVRNKIRAMGAKNPIVMADPDEVEKSWDKGKKDDDVKEEVTARQIEAIKKSTDRARSGRRQEDGSKINPNPTPVKTGKPLTKKPAKVGKEAEPKKEKPRYNPFKDGRTPTSASQTTGP